MKKEKVSRGWRTLAIILLIISVLMIILTIISIRQDTQQVKDTNICYYDICVDYPDAYYENDVCTCYDYDILGNEQVAYTEYMGKR